MKERVVGLRFGELQKGKRLWMDRAASWKSFDRMKPDFKYYVLGTGRIHVADLTPVASKININNTDDP